MLRMSTALVAAVGLRCDGTATTSSATGTQPAVGKEVALLVVDALLVELDDVDESPVARRAVRAITSKRWTRADGARASKHSVLVLCEQKTTTKKKPTHDDNERTAK